MPNLRRIRVPVYGSPIDDPLWRRLWLTGVIVEYVGICDGPEPRVRMECFPDLFRRGKTAYSVAVKVAFATSAQDSDKAKHVLVSFPRITASSTRSACGTPGIFSHILSSVNGICVCPGYGNGLCKGLFSATHRHRLSRYPHDRPFVAERVERESIARALSVLPRRLVCAPLRLDSAVFSARSAQGTHIARRDHLPTRDHPFYTPRVVLLWKVLPTMSIAHAGNHERFTAPYHGTFHPISTPDQHTRHTPRKA